MREFLHIYLVTWLHTDGSAWIYGSKSISVISSLIVKRLLLQQLLKTSKVLLVSEYPAAVV